MSDTSNDIRAALLEQLEAQVVLGDTKAALIVAADAILITGYISGIKEFGLAGMLSRGTVMLLIAALVILVAGLILALIAVMPNSWHWRKSKRAYMDSVLLFSRIARYESPQEYVEDFVRLDDKTLNDELLHQVYGKSKWALYKFGIIWWSVALTILSVSLAAISILIDISVKWIQA